ncbi:ribosome silencing factor [Hydrogenophilus thiooxidans]|uniref:ribosome silencing factor n=1 Tax=Hydrogenophilus thiooxidans TaxID=2820326 RepID=UPI001C248D78|nr:ribosome silencing factor [Hydrogenophilus thiooxidans]
MKSSDRPMDTNALTQLAIAALEAVKGEAIEAYDTTQVTPLFERVVIASGNSTRQVKALARNVVEEAKKHHVPIVGVEGEEGGEWVLVDLGPVVIHVMLPAVRRYYRLEELWGMPPATRVAAANLSPSQNALGQTHPILGQSYPPAAQ